MPLKRDGSFVPTQPLDRLTGKKVEHAFVAPIIRQAYLNTYGEEQVDEHIMTEMSPQNVIDTCADKVHRSMTPTGACMPPEYPPVLQRFMAMLPDSPGVLEWGNTLDDIENDSSAGPPFAGNKLQVINHFGGKLQFIDFVKNFSESGEITDSLYSLFLKEELRKKGKGSRTLAACNLVDYVLAQRLNGAHNQMLYTVGATVTTPFAPGMSIAHGGWHKLALRLRCDEARRLFWCIDFDMFDTQLCTQMATAIMQRRVSSHDPRFLTPALVQAYFNEAYGRLVSVYTGKKSGTCVSGLKSGTLNTTVHNTFHCAVVVIDALLTATGRGLDEIPALLDEFPLAVYGDDVIVSLPAGSEALIQAMEARIESVGYKFKRITVGVNDAEFLGMGFSLIAGSFWAPRVLRLKKHATSFRFGRASLTRTDFIGRLVSFRMLACANEVHDNFWRQVCRFFLADLPQDVPFQHKLVLSADQSDLVDMVYRPRAFECGSVTEGLDAFFHQERACLGEAL